MITPAEFLFLSALSFLFGVTQKLADGHHEHGLNFFPGAGIFFGTLTGGIAFYLIGYSPVLQAVYLGSLLYWFYKQRVDCLPHIIAAILMLLGVFISIGNFDFPLGGVLLVSLGCVSFDLFKRHNPWPTTAPLLTRPWWLHFHLIHLALAIGMGSILGYSALFFNLLGTAFVEKLFAIHPATTTVKGNIDDMAA